MRRELVARSKGERGAVVALVRRGLVARVEGKWKQWRPW